MSRALLITVNSRPPSHGGRPGVDAIRVIIDYRYRNPPIIEECYQQALITLHGNRDRLDPLAPTFLDRETLDEDEAYTAAGIRPGTAPAAIARGEAGDHPAMGQRRAAASVSTSR